MAASPMLLLTRPFATSQKLSATLAALGYRTLIAPVLDIKPLATAFPALEKPNAVMITSAHALLALAGRMADIVSMLALPCYCVGHATADAARAAGFTHVQASDGDGTVLAGLIHTHTPTATRILHIAARDIASAAATHLHAQDIQIIEWPVYQADTVAHWPAETVAALQGGDISAALVFSTRSASALAALITQYGLRSCCPRLGAIGISEAVLSPLRSLPWQQIAAAATPNEKAVIARVQALYPIAEMS